MWVWGSPSQSQFTCPLEPMANGQNQRLAVSYLWATNYCPPKQHAFPAPVAVYESPMLIPEFSPSSFAHKSWPVQALFSPIRDADSWLIPLAISEIKFFIVRGAGG